MRTKMPLPKGWKKQVKSSVLHALSLARYCLLVIRGRAVETSRRGTRVALERDHLRQEVALLREELRIKDIRMNRIPPHRRPHYPPTERMAILELRATRGWTLEQTAKRFFLTPLTVASWVKRLDEEGASSLLRVREPVNKFPDFVRYIVQRLKVLCPRMGKVKIAETLCRAGLHLGPTTVGRILKEKPKFPDAADAKVSGPVVTAKNPNHVWHVDLTAIPTSDGLWTSWFPLAMPQCWPFCWWVAIVLDHFSRRVLGVEVFSKRPDSQSIATFLNLIIGRARAKPRHLISDQGRQFISTTFRQWCLHHGIRQRFGAVGMHGSIAVIERFMLTLKNECTRLIQVSLGRDEMHAELMRFLTWYDHHRPHSSLEGRTPDEVYFNQPPASQQPRLEPRPRWPRGRPCAMPQVDVKGKSGTRVVLDVKFLEGRRHLPVVSLKAAA